MDFGKLWWMTSRTSGLSIPMPKAIVATITLTSSLINFSWFSFLVLALIIKEIYVSLPPRIGVLKSTNEDTTRDLSASANGDRKFNSTVSSHSVARGLSWREANERARILFYRGKHPAIHYDEQAAAFDVRMLLETASGGTQEIPVTDSDVSQKIFHISFQVWFVKNLNCCQNSHHWIAVTFIEIDTTD